MKWLKRIAIILLALIVLAGLLTWWILGSESGARFALERAKHALADKLSYAQAHGALASPLTLEGLRYRDTAAGIDISIQSVKVEYALSGLFSRTLRVASLDIGDIDIALTSVAPTTPTVPTVPAPSTQALLTPPLAIYLDRVHVGHIKVSSDGQPVFASDSLDTALSWTSAALDIRQFTLRATDGKVDLSGALNSYSDYRGKGQLVFDWRLGEQRAAGTLGVSNDGNAAVIDLDLKQPLAATAHATAQAQIDTLPWTIALQAPRFNPAQLSGNATLKSLAARIEGTGDRTHGKVAGSVEINGHTVLLDPLQYSLEGKKLHVDALHLRSPEATGVLTLQANAQLDADPVAGDVAVDWQGVELPADLVGQALATHGHLKASGNANQFNANSELALGPPGNLADIALEIAGTPQAITLRRLALKQPRGGFEAHGDIALQPRLRWQLDAKATKLDPGAFAKDWPGAIDFTLSTNGQMEKDGPAGQLRLSALGGTLRQRALAGSADLRFAAPLTVDGTLDVKSGNSSITLKGRSGDHTDVNIDLAIASLGDWLPQAGGGLRGNLSLQGTWPRLDARGKFDATKLAFGENHIDAAAITLDVHDVSAPSGNLKLDGKNLAAGGYLFDVFTVDAHGSQSTHSVGINLQGPQLGIELAVEGALTERKNGNDWNGRLNTFALTPKGATPWSLQHPAQVKYIDGGLDLGELCLAADASSLCASATQSAAGATQARFSIAHLPLTMIARLASPDAPLKLDGEINGEGEIRRSAEGLIDGQAKISSTSGTVAYPDSATQPLIAYKDLAFTANLTPQQSTLEVRGTFDDGGHLDGHVTLGAAAAGGMPLSGMVNATLNNLGFIDLLSEQTSSTKGKVDAHLTLGGTTAAPAVSGNFALADFASEIPAAGLKLRDGRVTLQSADGSTFVVDGSVASGDGKLALSGNVGSAAQAPIALKISGENFLAADIPGAQVRISPDLNVTRSAGKFSVTGSVGIPKADIDVSKLPGGGAATTSPDVVVTDSDHAKPGAATVVDADVTVKFGAGEKLDMDLRQGQEVHLVGFGLNGYLSGQLAVQERPGHPTSGRGQIVVDGTYKAYGQDLKIEQGRLLFAGTPVENPGLDLRATRGFTDPDVTVGLQVRGTAEVPVLTVFSTPAMEQSDALSYLVAGKPLSQLKSGEGDAVGSAARALGTAGGDLLAKSIGTRMGLDDVGVADSSAVGGAALTVGKYLSPRLYLSYGVGLFTPGEVVTLRYRLSRLFNVEVQNGTLSSRAGINYKIEK